MMKNVGSVIVSWGIHNSDSILCLVGIENDAGVIEVINRFENSDAIEIINKVTKLSEYSIVPKLKLKELTGAVVVSWNTDTPGKEICIIGIRFRGSIKIVNAYDGKEALELLDSIFKKSTQN